MKHNLKVSVSKNPNKDSILQCRKVTMREKIIQFLC